MTQLARALGGGKAKAVFDVLTAADGATVSVERLAQALWRKAAPRDSACSLAAYVEVLRNRIQPGVVPAESVIVACEGGYRLDPSRATMTAPDRVRTAG